MGILYVPYPRSFCNDQYWCNGHHKKCRRPGFISIIWWMA
uniref:Uncharacterized protein n=1 Tax=Arundo donax TaxID=35708 RepID=A0A0A9GV17_ARUDO